MLVTVVAALGVCLIVQSASLVWASPPGLYAAVLCGLIVVTGHFKIKVPRRPATVSVSEVFVFSSVLVFGPAAATLSVALDGLFASLGQRSRRSYRTVFNITEPAVSVWIAGHVFLAVTRWLPVSSSGALLILPAAAMAGAYFLLNMGFTGAAVALETGESVLTLWRGHALFVAINYFAGAWLAAAVVEAVPRVHPAVFGLVAPLLVLSFVAYQMVCRRIEETDQHLQEERCHVTELSGLQQKLQVKAEQLQGIADTLSVYLETESWPDASRKLLRAALDQTGSASGFAGVLVDGPALRILAREGMQPPQDGSPADITDFKSLFGAVVTTGQPILRNDLTPEECAVEAFAGSAAQSLLAVPITWGSEVVGLIGVTNREGGFSSVEQSNLEVLAQMAGVLYDSYRRSERAARLQAQLQQVQKMEAVGRLTGGIAHDFNNLLTVILGFGELGLGQLGVDHPARPDLEAVIEAGRSATALTRQLLAFSRKQILDPQVLELSGVVRSLQPLVKRLIGEDIELTFHAADAAYVSADRGHIEQVLMNLAVNARDAMLDGGRIAIEVSSVTLDEVHVANHPGASLGPHVMLALRDTGCGMSETVKAHLFEPFFTTKEPGKGTGMGLATVHGIVHQSGGSIGVDSEVGRGTTFRVYLPQIDEPETADALTPVPVAPLGGTETVLIVEDEAEVRCAARETLRRMGYTVREAVNGVHALSIAAEHAGPVHLLLTDVIMPQLNGAELAAQFSIAYPDTRILFMSGYTDDALGRHGVLDSPHAFIQKPFTPDKLLHKVRDVLAARTGADRRSPRADAAATVPGFTLVA